MRTMTIAKADDNGRIVATGQNKPLNNESLPKQAPSNLIMVQWNSASHASFLCQ